MDLDPRGSLEEQVGELRSRVQRIEEVLSRQGVPFPEFLAPHQERGLNPREIAETCISAVPGDDQRDPTPTSPQTTPSFGYSVQTEANIGRSLESRIGSQWFNRVGIEPAHRSFPNAIRAVLSRLRQWSGYLVIVASIEGTSRMGARQKFAF